MENNKKRTYGIYLLLILAGILVGWLLYGRAGSDDPHHDHGHETDHHADHDHQDHQVEHQNDHEYTCSMHPQVRQDEPGDCPICGMDLIPVSDEDDHQDDDPFLFTMQERHLNWANVQTTTVRTVHDGVQVRLTGKVAVNEKEQRLVTAHFPGRIEYLSADYTGRFIRKGEKLATLYSPELMQARQELIQAFSVKETQPRLYESARRRLELFNLTESQIDNIVESGQASPFTDVYATRSGYVEERYVAEGDYVGTGQTLFAIAGLSNVWVELDAYESHIGLIEPGNEVRVQVAAYPGKEFTGRVEFVDPFLDNRTRSSRVRLTVDNPENRLKPGMLVNATLTTATADHPRVVVPSTAVLWTGPRSLVYVKSQRHDGFTFEFREIDLGARTGQGYFVHKGLTEGEEVAVNGVFAIDAAAQLRGHYSMMAPPEKTEIPEPFRSNLESLFEIYFQMKNALAEDDPETATEHGHRLHQQLEETGEHSLDGEHHMFWMERYGQIDESIEAFLGSAAIEEMREYFEPLSGAFIETARTLGAIGATWYVAYCPMVDDNTGAYWLSEFEEILNPYFGSMMLRCGEVRETIREGIGSAPADEPREMAGHVH